MAADMLQNLRYLTQAQSQRQHIWLGKNRLKKEIYQNALTAIAKIRKEAETVSKEQVLNLIIENRGMEVEDIEKSLIDKRTYSGNMFETCKRKNNVW